VRTVLLVALASFAAAPALAAGACVPSCGVPSSTLGYVPPVTVVASGATVTWSALDEAHTATAEGAPLCFNVGYGPNNPGSATFRVDATSMYARVGATERVCASATALPDGSFALRYRCVFHGTMNGVIIVIPEATP
jgi:plastocyanin